MPSMVTGGPEHSLPIKIEADCEVQVVTFFPNGEYLVGIVEQSVQVWQVKDGELVATMNVENLVYCLTISKDGKWIAAGAENGAFVWDATTYEETFRHKDIIRGIDFSPIDSSRLVLASWTGPTTVWNVDTHERLRTLLWPLDQPLGGVVVAKYSPQGDRIATGTFYPRAVEVWNSNNGQLIASVGVKVNPWFNSGHLWFVDNVLSVVSDGAIKQFSASTGFAISEQPLHGSNATSCITRSCQMDFIIYSTVHATWFLDMATSNPPRPTQHYPGTSSMALSPGDQLLAISQCENITIMSLSRITEPDIQINNDVLDLWKQGQLAKAEELLTTTILKSPDSNHHLFANRALLRVHLQQWKAALIDVDSEMATNLQPSIIGYIAKSMAHVGQGEKHEGYDVCDVAFKHFPLSYGNFILLIKAIIVFMAGEHHDAISLVDNLITTVHLNRMCHIVQAYMYLLLGKLQIEHGDYDGAIQLLEHARAHMQPCGGPPLLVISLISGWKFDDTGIMTRRYLCEALYEARRTKDAVECFYHMASEVAERNPRRDHLEWAHDFCQRSCEKLEHLGDAEMDAERFEEAVSHYTTALSLNPASPRGILLKRKKAFTATGTWERALDDANQAITLNPSSPWGYEMKHAALHRAGNYGDAVDAFEAMLSRITESPEQDVQQYGDQFISPSNTRATIRKIVQRTIRHIPRVLISTSTGRLCDKMRQASAFESVPMFNELVSSMTTRINYVRIKHEVRQFFRYAMLSHRWEENEPLFQQVANTSVYSLDESPTHNKLWEFCNIVLDAGFEWAWSDTCCINKSDNFVLQEALVAMFRWYQCAALVIVFLRGVRSWSQLGALVASIWNTRAWTLQEYIAARVIRFYTEDWTPYLDLELLNHKESPEIISEMERATGVSAQKLKSLRPGLTSIREKLRLASTRQTTLEEDAAYSLLGIFSVTGLPAIYGEGNGSLGRLLAHVLTVSGDVSILAWSGESGSFNSCLPAHITVFDKLATSHLPLPIPDAEMERITAVSRPSSFDLDAALELYDRLNGLPAAAFTASRMKLPCIAFQLPSFLPHQTDSGRVYRADTVEFGTVEIKTRHNLARMQHLYLVHPWLDAVLDRASMHIGMIVEDDITSLSDIDDDEGGDDGLPDHFSTSGPESQLFPTAPFRALTAPMDEETRARRLAARLRQPFGALLLTLAPTGRIGVDYRRVAVDSRITVHIREDVPLADLLANVRTLDVL